MAEKEGAEKRRRGLPLSGGRDKRRMRDTLSITACPGCCLDIREPLSHTGSKGGRP